MSVAKEEASAATVSGGHPGMCTSSYACNVFFGGDGSDERVDGFGRRCPGFEMSGIEGPREDRVTFTAGPRPLNAASEEEGMRSYFGF